MPPKSVTIQRNKKAAIPYLQTRVSFTDSVADIKSLLMKFGCERIVEDYSQREKNGVTEPCHTLGFVMKGHKFIIEFPITYLESPKKRELNMNVSGRIVYNKIKTLLTDVELGYLSFTESMLQYRMIEAPDGNVVSLMEAVEKNAEQIQRRIVFPQLTGGN